MPSTQDLPHSDDIVRLAEALGPALLRLVRQFRLGIHTVGPPPAQVMLLRRIAERPGIGVSELAATECIRRATISGHMRDIAAAGLVERLPQDPDDRRRGGFAVTPAGLRLLDEVKRQWTAWLAHRILDLPDEGREALAASLPYLRHLGAGSAAPHRRSAERDQVAPR